MYLRNAFIRRLSSVVSRYCIDAGCLLGSQPPKPQKPFRTKRGHVEITRVPFRNSVQR